MDLVLVTGAALFAGLVDSMVGGGGLVLSPALLSTYPSAPPATLFGTGKSGSVWGTAISALQFQRRVRLRLVVFVPAAGVALCAAAAGARAVTHVDPQMLRQALPVVLLVVLVYTVARPDLGRCHAPRHGPRGQTAIACAIGASVGVYDGFFGPGTGSFLMFLLARCLGYDFLHAAAGAKWLNTATNLAALGLFAGSGHVWWKLGALIAVANVLGSVIGSRLALKHGVSLVRRVFIVVVALLLLKTGADALGFGAGR